MTTVQNTFREMLSKKRRAQDTHTCSYRHKKKPPVGEVFVKGECFNII
jgi:hypothetical protein